MVPTTLWFFCIESTSHLLLTLLLGAALLILDVLICALVFEIKRHRGSLTLVTFVRIKHHVLLLLIPLTSLLFLQTYLAIAAIVLFIWRWDRIAKADMRILRMEEYPTLQRHAERRRNKGLIVLAESVQESTADEPRSAFFARYRATYEEIQASDAEIFLHAKQFNRSYLCELLLPTGLFGSLAVVVKVVALLSLNSICYDTASGFPRVFLMINAILTLTVLFAGLVYGAIRWESHFPSSHGYPLVFCLILLYLVIAALIVVTTFGLY